MIKILFIGDIVGEQGLDLTLDLLPRMRNDYGAEFIIVNGENIKNGRGLNKQLLQRLENSDVGAVTSGNHIWDGKADSNIFENSKILLRPHNYPAINPGTGMLQFKLKNNHLLTILNLQGRGFMNPIDCPFRTADDILNQSSKNMQLCIVDFHAESTAEKQALAWHLDGRVSAIIGTHTHVQTADNRIFPGGTAYITDVGMTGPGDGVIGMDKNVAINRFRYQTPHYFKIAQGTARLNGVFLEIDEKNYKTKSITRLNFSKAEYNGRKIDQRQ